MGRSLRWYDTIILNSIFTGLTLVAQTMTPLLIPLFVQSFIGVERQGAYYGIVRLGTLMTALLAQSVVGTISDHSKLRAGKRRPFILIGCISALIFILAIGFTPKYAGITGFWIFFSLLIFLMISLNSAQGAAQGLIPDLVPLNLRGRYSGVKAILEVPIPLIIVALSIAKFLSNGNHWAALFTVMGVLSISMIISMFAPESKPTKDIEPIKWDSIFRLFFMTITFTLIIILSGWFVRITGTWLDNLDPLAQLSLVGIIGALSMLLTIVIGVLISIQIGIGPGDQQRKSFAWWVINRLAFLAGVTNLGSFALFYIQSRLGISGADAAQPASILLVVVGIFITISALPSGWISDRIGTKRLVILSGIIATVGTFVVIIAGNLFTIYIGGTIIGIATGSFFTSNWSLGTKLVPLDQSAKYLGISNLAGAGAGAIGAFIGGSIADSLTEQIPQLPGIGYILIYIIFGFLFIFSVIAAGRIQASGVYELAQR